MKHFSYIPLTQLHADLTVKLKIYFQSCKKSSEKQFGMFADAETLANALV